LPPMTQPSVTVTTTTLKVACLNNSMCAKPVPYVPFCEEKIVKNPDIKYTCIHPGSSDSYCQALVVEPKLVKVCDDAQYCWLGECYPNHCRNKARDYLRGEDEIDCGGPCRRCNESDVICAKNTDCGKDECGTPFCNKARNPAHNCSRNVCNNPGLKSSTCEAQTTTEVMEVCDQWEKCVEGQDNCLQGRGDTNCHNCIQDQGESGIDCGGPCTACSTAPYTYDTMNLTATETFEYQGYKLKLDRLIREINCSTGANIQATDPYGFSKSNKITRYENTEFYDLAFGILETTPNSVKIWITKKVPL
jgi:hypothetical protein